MCHQITCPTCNKPTWEGCGEHIEYALKGVPLNERCTCPRSAPKNSSKPANPKGPHTS